MYVASGAIEIDGQRFESGQMIVLAPGSTASFTALEPRGRDGARRRTGRPALHRVEFRLFIARAHRASESGLARRTHEVAPYGRSRMDSAAAGSASAARARFVEESSTTALRALTRIRSLALLH